MLISQSLFAITSHHFWGCDAQKRHKKGGTYKQGNYNILDSAQHHILGDTLGISVVKPDMVVRQNGLEFHATTDLVGRLDFSWLNVFSQKQLYPICLPINLSFLKLYGG